jgi:hypothetical protein
MRLTDVRGPRRLGCLHGGFKGGGGLWRLDQPGIQWLDPTAVVYDGKPHFNFFDFMIFWVLYVCLLE